MLLSVTLERYALIDSKLEKVVNCLHSVLLSHCMRSEMLVIALTGKFRIMMILISFDLTKKFGV